MRNILALIGAGVVVFAGLGWYLEWYKLGSNSGKLELDVNTTKVVSDLKKGEKKAETLINNQSKGSSSTPTPTPEKKVEGQTTGLIQFNPDGSQSITLPKLEVKGN